MLYVLPAETTLLAIDYERIAAFWRDQTNGKPGNLDYVAGQNPTVPEAVHAHFRALQIEYFDRHILPTSAPDLDVLDLGCGPGTWALHIAPRVRSLVGVDIAPAFVAHATSEAARRGLVNTEFRVGSFLDFASDRKFGLVLLGAMLVYVDDPELAPFLARVRSMLTPSGSVYARTAVAPRRPYARRGRYQAIYRTRDAYERAFREAGFSCAAARDLAYTDASIAAVYCGIVRAASLGLARGGEPGTRWPAGRSVARRLIDLTPAPRCYHFLLGGTR